RDDAPTARSDSTRGSAGRSGTSPFPLRPPAVVCNQSRSIEHRRAQGARRESRWVMPELPEMQALAERLDAVLRHQAIARLEPISFSGLRTVAPTPAAVGGQRIEGVGRRGKYLVITLE